MSKIDLRHEDTRTRGQEDTESVRTYVVEGLVKVGAGRWVVWTASGSYAVKDFGHIEEGMLSFTASIDADSEAAAIAEFVGTYFPMSDDGPEVFDEVLIRSS